MLLIGTIFLTIACLSQPTLAKTVKQKRALGDMATEYLYDLGGSGVYEYTDDNLAVYFIVTYDKKFNDDWLTIGSKAFMEEADLVASSMKNVALRATELGEMDVTVEVIGFIPSPTKAEIVVKIPAWLGISESEVAQSISGLESYGTIDGAKVQGIEELMSDVPMSSVKSEAIILEMVYDYDTSSGSLDLSDPESEAFLAEAKSLKTQLVLYIIDKLAQQDIVANSDQIVLNVLKFTSEGTYTNAEISVRGDGIDIEQLSYALQFLVIDNEVRINEHPVIALDEISREFLYYDDEPSTEEEVMEKFLNGFETSPTDDGEDIFHDITSEVMHGKMETLNGELPPDGDFVEATPPDYTDDYYSLFIPNLVPPSRGDNTISGLEKEGDPSDAAGDSFPSERTPPDVVEPTPSDEIRYCERLTAPLSGEIDCINGNMEGSFCHFTCSDETRMEGPDTVICSGGRWDADPPVCRRIVCEPSYRTTENGGVVCNNNNLFESVCVFACNSEFRLVGERSIMCQRDQRWSAEAPICEPEPVICEDEYGEWSECEGGERFKENVTIVRGGVTTDCPRVTEVCIDCQLDWKPWSECDARMVRYREQFVSKEKVGAGQECPEPKVESQECRDCVINWEEWGECVDGKRNRVQYVEQRPIGGAECPPLDEQEQECSDCKVTWGEWSACIEGVSSRNQSILSGARNGGKACPELGHEEEECQNCIAEWGDWSACEDGKSTRSQVVSQRAARRGRECDLQSEEEECADCRVAWSGWSSCENGVSERAEVVTQPQVGRGGACPELQTEFRDCVHCRLEWGDWEECIGGRRRRAQFVAEEAVGAGDLCDVPEVEFKECANCVLDWGEWGECSDGYRRRKQFIHQEAYEVDEPCPELRTETQPCVDCVYTWEEWGECQFGLERRYMNIEVDPVGSGEACPEEQAQIRECCYLEWTEWSQCENGARTRIQEVLVEPPGAVCPEPQVESQACADCELGWGSWSECQNNKISRTQIVVKEAEGAGERCPEVLTETEYCADCIVDWGPWEECSGGIRLREQYIAENRVGAGKACPELQLEEEACVDCEWERTEWSGCANGQRHRDIVITRPSEGVGEACPDETREYEQCVDCVVEWGDWTQCQDGETSRTQFVAVAPVGEGRECPELRTEVDVCVDCVLEWEDWSECSDGSRTRTQRIRIQPEGRGLECPRIGTMKEDCVDCVVGWGEWTKCFSNLQRREHVVVTHPVGAGQPCPRLDVESRECSSDSREVEKTICRFVDVVLGWKRSPTMRDLVLLGDESGSIGWVNFDKIKSNFKSIVRNLRGGIGSQETQVAMTSFARFSRIIFDFDDYYDVGDVENAIDEVIFKGGFRSRIGGALSDVNRWVFQQSAGMRSFPGKDDNIDHEILIATDGCRTYDAYHLKRGLKALKSRGVRLFVLAVAAKDERCQETIKSMVDDENNLFELGSWEDLDEMTRVMDERACVVPSADEDEDDIEAEEAGP